MLTELSLTGLARYVASISQGGVISTSTAAAPRCDLICNLERWGWGKGKRNYHQRKVCNASDGMLVL